MLPSRSCFTTRWSTYGLWRTREVVLERDLTAWQMQSLAFCQIRHRVFGTMTMDYLFCHVVSVQSDRPGGVPEEPKTARLG